MKNYDVYAIGNALVDYEFKVSENDLKTLSVDKGIMTLIDENRHAVLLEYLGNSYTKKACGGSAANSIIAVSQLGGSSFYSCKVADDASGDFYLNDLSSFGVDINKTSIIKDHITGECFVLVTDDAARSMNTFLGATQTLTKEVINEEAIKSSQFLYIEGYLSSEPLALEAALESQRIAHENEVKVALTLSDPNMVRFCRDGLDSIVNNGLDLLFCNEQEAIEYAKCDDVISAIPILEKHAETVVITLGPRGVMVCHGEEVIEVPTSAVNAIDTTGAGDMFAGAFLYALTQGQTHEIAAKLANYASGLIIQKFGPRLESADAKLIQNFAKGVFI